MNKTQFSQNTQPEIIQFSCLSDNYCSLIHDPVSGHTAVIDTPDAAEIIRQLEARNWQLSHILTTHHHWDHIDGHLELKDRYNCTVIGSEINGDIIPGIDRAVGHGDQVQLGEINIEVLATPGHTLGHIVYWVPSLDAVFVGDTLFSMGCGRLFEGSPQQMWQSLQKLRDLPPATAIYCGHEYTLSNARFALALEPNNVALQQRVAEVEKLRADNLPTLPTSVLQEINTNPFMRADRPELQQQLNMLNYPADQVFAEIRQQKDQA